MKKSDKDITKEKTNRQLRSASKKADRTPEQSRYALKRLVKLFYDYQRLRIQAAGRTYERAEGTTIDLADEDIEILGRRSNELLVLEKEVLKDIDTHLSTMPAYINILADKTRFKGIGPTMAGVILSEVDITRCNTVSGLWKYAGLAPIPSQRCSKCNDEVKLIPKSKGLYMHTYARTEKCAMAKKELTKSQTFASGRAMRPTKGEKLPYNSFFKTKMVGVMASCLLKANSPYRKFYDDYKHRLVSSGKGRTDGHRHQMAMRYMVKMVLADIWKDWRTLEGLDVRESYQEQYLNHKHHA